MKAPAVSSQLMVRILLGTFSMAAMKFTVLVSSGKGSGGVSLSPFRLASLTKWRRLTTELTTRFGPSNMRVRVSTGFLASFNHSIPIESFALFQTMRALQTVCYLAAEMQEQ